MEEEEMENFLKLVDENGEISKDNLIIQVFKKLPTQLKFVIHNLTSKSAQYN